jgi:hypothetical protein
MSVAWIMAYVVTAILGIAILAFPIAIRRRAIRCWDDVRLPIAQAGSLPRRGRIVIDGEVYRYEDIDYATNTLVGVRPVHWWRS